MPLSTNEQTNVTAGSLVAAIRAGATPHLGYRPNHTKGTLITGNFTPTPEATALTSAQHFQSGTVTPVTLRFSAATGIPTIADNIPESSPRGLAIRFHLGGRRHTDIVSHSIPFSPAKTGEDLLSFLQAAGTGPEAVGDYLATHPETAAFIAAPKPVTESFVGLTFWAVNAFKFIAADGTETFVRYRVLPTVGTRVLSEEELGEKGPDFLFEELRERLDTGPVELKLVVQVAEGDDVTDDGTVYWPEDRKIVELGTFKLEAEVESQKNNADQKYIIFDPIPRVSGIEPSNDPLLEVRAAAYLISGRERRAAPDPWS
ncbi:hypothetical protein DRE_01090 [Drechslerella stenobrocha 248]|uniref:Catalase core domain-containing protein n=1 Tax=Drechslerella stenobrocha 248 TaxID=1043628 RepID=W7HMD1_9PEZI|nr:hypothetical protein DRE_01090 [Drechslerella stenobrocha 248]